jgi:hypothetical protein
MVDGHTNMGSDVSKKTVGTAVQVVSGNNLVSWLQQSQDDIQSCHSRRDSECMSGRRDFGDVVFYGKIEISKLNKLPRKKKRTYGDGFSSGFHFSSSHTRCQHL